MYNLSNLLYLTRCGFYDCLEEGGLVGPDMDMQCRAHEPLQLSFSNIAALEQKPNKKLKNIQLLFSFAAMLSFRTMLRNVACDAGRSYPGPKNLQW